MAGFALLGIYIAKNLNPNQILQINQTYISGILINIFIAMFGKVSKYLQAFEPEPPPRFDPPPAAPLGATYAAT